jgi:hypothetical protein
MKAQFGQYLNEIVSLSIMLLMAVALIAGQAGASAHEVAPVDTNIIATPTPFLDVSGLIETDFAVLSFRIDMVFDHIVESLPVGDTTETLGEVVSAK